MDVLALKLVVSYSRHTESGAAFTFKLSNGLAFSLTPNSNPTPTLLTHCCTTRARDGACTRCGLQQDWPADLSKPRVSFERWLGPVLDHYFGPFEMELVRDALAAKIESFESQLVGAAWSVAETRDQWLANNRLYDQYHDIASSLTGPLFPEVQAA